MTAVVRAHRRCRAKIWTCDFPDLPHVVQARLVDQACKRIFMRCECPDRRIRIIRSAGWRGPAIAVVFYDPAGGPGSVGSGRSFYDDDLREIRLAVAPHSRGLGTRLLITMATVLPNSVRADWLEEHRAYLADLPIRRIKLQWLCRELRGMPRYAYTVRTKARKEAT